MNCSQPPAHAQPHGLLNQGSTCYLNSVLQVLFMTRDFREAVERHMCENPESEWIDWQLKDLFDDLQQRTAYTCKITNKLGIDNVYEQRDAAEYFEKILSMTNPDASQIFHGECTHKTTCSVCHTCSEADGHFWHLPLELLDSYSDGYSVVDGVEQYFQTSYFGGEDQMYCDQCDAKSDATTKCVMKHHPEVLTLLLKRFDFDYSYMRYVKNNRAVDIPFILRIPENQTYTLYGFVDHFGDLRSGHYMATVKSPDDERWYKLNDASVTPINCLRFQGNIIGNSSSVYLLFYKKTTTHVAETCTHGIISNGSPPVDKTAVTEGEEGEEEGTEVGDDKTTEDIAMDIDQPKKRVEYQDNGARQQSNNQGWNDESGYPLAEKPKQDKKDIIKDDQEGGPTETEEQAAQRELFLTNNQRKDSKVKDQDFGESEKYYMPDINPEFKPETSDRHDHLDKDNKMGEKRGEGSVLDADTEKQKQNEGKALKDGEDGGHTGADEQVEQSKIEDQDVGDTGNNGDIHKRLDTNHEFKANSSDDHHNKGDEMSEERVKNQDLSNESIHSHEYDQDALKQNEVNISKDDEEADKQVGEDQDTSNAPTDDVQVESNHRLARPEHICTEDEMREVQKGVLTLKIARVESSQGDGEEIKEESSLENLVVDTQNQTTEGVRKNHNNDQENKQEDGQNHGPQFVSLDKKVDKEKGEIEVKDDSDRQTGAHQQTLRKRHYSSCDHCYPTVIEDKRRALEKREDGLPYRAGVGDGERQKRSEENSLSDRHEQQGQEGRDRNQGKEQSRRDDEPAQRKEISPTKRGLSASLEDENEGELDAFKQNKPEQQISVSHTKPESVSAENKTTQGDSKPKEVTEGGSGSEIVYKIIEEGFVITPGGKQISTGSKTIRTERIGKLKNTQTEKD